MQKRNSYTACVHFTYKAANYQSKSMNITNYSLEELVLVGGPNAADELRTERRHAYTKPQHSAGQTSWSLRWGARRLRVVVDRWRSCAKCVWARCPAADARNLVPAYSCSISSFLNCRRACCRAGARPTRFGGGGRVAGVRMPGRQRQTSMATTVAVWLVRSVRLSVVRPYRGIELTRRGLKMLSVGVCTSEHGQTGKLMLRV
jgi:hypothetical protein